MEYLGGSLLNPVGTQWSRISFDLVILEGFYVSVIALSGIEFKIFRNNMVGIFHLYQNGF